MKYMLLIYHDERAFGNLTEDERQAIYRDYRQLREELTSNGKFITGSQLQPTSTANSVRVRNGKQLTTDGPFAETKEQLGGYFLIEAETIAEANAIAARIPSAKTGTIEVRARLKTGTQNENHRPLSR
jgi:hypothetical protein